MKKVAICQSNYIPWKGYFDMINMADVFVIYDHVQYTKNDWRNRNVIKTPTGINWLTIPVRQERLDQSIDETQISWNKWNIKHWKSIVANYAKTPYFKEYKDFFEELYNGATSHYLSEINVRFIKGICEELRISTEMRYSREFQQKGDRNDNLINICLEVGANTYVSGPAAKSYLDLRKFEENGISVQWMNYEDYPVYRQQYEPFAHGVSIIDVIFNLGSGSKDYLKSFG
ncbi:MAG: WbqC family protein [Saprospiraceae bacterium]|nr:WbqC family protein [Saprospiraceae bacterium]